MHVLCVHADCDVLLCVFGSAVARPGGPLAGSTSFLPLSLHVLFDLTPPLVVSVCVFVCVPSLHRGHRGVHRGSIGCLWGPQESIGVHRGSIGDPMNREVIEGP